VDEFANTEYINSLRKFIEMNTSVTSLSFLNLNYDFGEEMKFNYHLIHLDGHYPWTKYYLERNKNLLEIVKKFHVKPILQVKSFDISFHF
jgi:hypothetical protein